jgi:carboxypeptidase Taq
MAETAWARFEPKMKEICDLDRVLALLGWDEETCLPGPGRAARGRQAATVEAIRHQRLLAPELEEAMAELEASPELTPPQRAMARLMRRRKRLASRIPEPLVKALAEARSPALGAWQEAKRSRQVGPFLPHLEKVLSLVRERGRALAEAGQDPYDALIDEFDPGTTQALLTPVFSRLVAALVPMLDRLASRPEPKAVFHQRFAVDRQIELGQTIAAELGFDLERGRQDRSAHPFCESIGLDDVRFTTRFDEDELTESLYGTIHEVGHGMYEQGFDRAFEGTELAKAPSMGLHESQSRLWENLIGRSRPFWARYLPLAQKLFPEALAGVSAEQAYQAVNVVRRGLIRVDADEVSYNLHIVLRFELERALIAGDLEVRDLPAVWNQKMKEMLGVVPAHDGEGCLQDIHWAGGAFGYFPSYTLGNLYASQLMAAYEREHPAVWSDVEAGRHAPLREWLRAKVHARGQSASAEQIVRDATGSGLDAAPFLAHLERKFA